MDSRQFAILVLAIFISTLALAFEENVTLMAPTSTIISAITPSTPKIEATTKFTADSSSTSTEPPPFAAKPTMTTPSSAASSSTIASVKVESTTVVDSVSTKPTEASAPSTTAAPIASTTNSAKSTEVVNDHSIREVSSEKCSTAYDAEDKVNWVLEKAILAVLEGNAVVTVEQLCKHLDAVKRLDAICNNTNVKLDSADSKVAPIVAGLNSMFSNVCSDNRTLIVPAGNSSLVPAGNSTPCVELIQSTTKNCSTNPLAKAIHVFPTEVLFEEMVKENCTVVFKTKECIINGLEQSDKCTEHQRVALKQAINMVTKVLPCSLPISAETTPATIEAPSTTAPITTTPTTTTTPTVITTKSHSHSSANVFQVNFFTVLPVLLLAFKFY